MGISGQGWDRWKQEVQGLIGSKGGLMETGGTRFTCEDDYY